MNEEQRQLPWYQRAGRTPEYEYTLDPDAQAGNRRQGVEYFDRGDGRGYVYTRQIVPIIDRMPTRRPGAPAEAPLAIPQTQPTTRSQRNVLVIPTEAAAPAAASRSRTAARS